MVPVRRSPGLMDVPARAATMAAFPDMFAQADEFGSTWLREIAAENHRQLDGDIVRLGAA